MMLDNEDLLKPPLARAAYSDRTAWLMAELSRMAYIRFEPSSERYTALIEALSELTEKKTIQSTLETAVQEGLLDLTGDTETLKELTSELSEGRFELVKPFNNAGTQAFLAKRDEDRIAVLAFRGTEPTDLRDLSADLNARFYKEDGVQTHTGFLKAYRAVEKAISEALSDVEGYQLYITGHSLGGALALIATRELASDTTAACYTFGSPRVGQSEFGDAIKVPIYRVVNASDAVPRLPPVFLLEAVLALVRALLYFISPVRDAVITFLSQFCGYSHHGDMRYLTHCKDDFSDLRLISNPNILIRARRMVRRWLKDWKAGFKDHSVDRYCEKLKAHAIKRLNIR